VAHDDPIFAIAANPRVVGWTTLSRPTASAALDGPTRFIVDCKLPHSRCLRFWSEFRRRFASTAESSPMRTTYMRARRADRAPALNVCNDPRSRGVLATEFDLGQLLAVKKG